MELKPIKKTLTLKEQAYHSIRSAIYSNTLKPGAPLAEEQLSNMLSISRTPIRSALQQLVYEKLASTDSTGHIFVSKIEEKSVSDITVMRLALEPLAIDLASNDIKPETLQRLNEIYQKQEELFQQDEENNLAFAELDSEFHTELSRISGNDIMVETISNLNSMMIRINVLSGTLNHHKQQALQEHRQLIQYLTNNQREFAKVALQEHIKNVGSRMFTK